MVGVLFRNRETKMLGRQIKQLQAAIDREEGKAEDLETKSKLAPMCIIHEHK